MVVSRDVDTGPDLGGRGKEEEGMFATIQRLQSLTLPIHGTVAEPYPNAIGAQVRVSCGGNSALAADRLVHTDARALAAP
jgi:hypothetical protein